MLRGNFSLDYLKQVSSGSYAGNLVPQIEENIELAIWKFPEEIPKLMKNAYENIKLLINKLV